MVYDAKIEKKYELLTKNCELLLYLQKKLTNK